MNKAVFLDRDGVLNECEEGKYVNCIAELNVFNYAGRAVKLLNDLNYKVLIVSNQSGIASGHISVEALSDINQKLCSCIKNDGGHIDGIYICPHDKYKNECNCRKPKPGLILQAAKEWDIDLSKSWMVGDMVSDINAGISAGVKTILVLSGLYKMIGVCDENINFPYKIFNDY